MKTVYYSYHGHEVLGILEGSAGDADLEDNLRASGVKFRKETVADKVAPTQDGKPHYQPGSKFIEGQVKAP